MAILLWKFEKKSKKVFWFASSKLRCAFSTVKFCLNRQQILSLRQVINEKTSHVEALQKRMNATHLVEMMTEKEEFYAEVY